MGGVDRLDRFGGGHEFGMIVLLVVEAGDARPREQGSVRRESMVSGSPAGAKEKSSSSSFAAVVLLAFASTSLSALSNEVSLDDSLDVNCVRLAFHD